MAYAARYSKYMTSTKSTGSDISESDSVAELLCDLCIHDDEYMEAKTFCKDCKQYLCVSCLKVHQRGATTKHHTVLNGQDLPLKASKDKKQQDHHRRTVEISNDNASNKKSVYLEHIVVRTARDNNKVQINALEVASDNLLLVCDYGNYKVKLLNPENDLVSEVGLSSEPYGMALVTSTEAIVTLPKESCLQLVKIESSRMLILRDKINTKFCCEKIRRYEENFIVTAYDKIYFNLSIVDKKGKLLHPIYNEPRNSLQVFKSYNEMFFCPENRTIYVTNKKLGCVGISLQGEMLFSFKESGESNHYGICTDTDGLVYIACYNTNKIVLINNMGQKIKDIVTLRGLKPSYVGYHQINKLFVAKVKTSKILCYQITV